MDHGLAVANETALIGALGPTSIAHPLIILTVEAKHLVELSILVFCSPCDHILAPDLKIQSGQIVEGNIQEATSWQSPAGF